MWQKLAPVIVLFFPLRGTQFRILNISFLALGEQAVLMFPEQEAHIRAVQKEKSFAVTDVGWISASLNLAIRVTIDADAYPCIHKHCPTVPRDALFGADDCSPVCAHLYFSWQKSVCGDRVFGHYNLLSPTKMQAVAKLLPPDVARSII